MVNFFDRAPGSRGSDDLDLNNDLKPFLLCGAASDMVAKKSKKMSWYDQQCLPYYMESIRSGEAFLSAGLG